MKNKNSFIEYLLLFLLLILFSLVRSRLEISWDMLWFILGGVVGIGLLPMAERHIHIQPSPFRSIVFVGGYIATAFFIATSATGSIGKGLVLGMGPLLFLYQLEAYIAHGSLSDWYQLTTVPSVSTQRVIFWSFGLMVLVIAFIILQAGA